MLNEFTRKCCNSEDLRSRKLIDAAAQLIERLSSELGLLPPQICAFKSFQLDIYIEQAVNICWMLNCSEEKSITNENHGVFGKIVSNEVSKGSHKKNWKKAVRLTAWVNPPSSPPPPKRSGKCEKFSTSCHIWGYFAIL